jgi:hypothetical protein
VLPREQASVKRIDRKSDVILLQSLQLLHVLPSNLRPLRPEHCGLARQQRPRWTATGFDVAERGFTPSRLAAHRTCRAFEGIMQHPADPEKHHSAPIAPGIEHATRCQPGG